MCGVLKTFSADFLVVMVHQWPHFSPVFSKYTLCYLTLPTSLTLSYFECPFSLANFMFSFFLSPSPAFFNLVFSSCTKSKGEDCHYRRVRVPYCLKSETNQFPLPPKCVRIHTHTYHTTSVHCVPVSRQDALSRLTWYFKWKCLVLT